jgi:uncharacterized protein DUF4255
VIQDLDDTLKALLVQEVPLDPADIAITFEMPTHEWSSKLDPARPTINLYLYDIRENVELRTSDRFLTTADDGSTVRQPVPVRIDFAYLISAWSKDIADEHRLLGQILAALLRFPELPSEVLQGSMQTQPYPLHAWIARPERLPNPWDFWGHVENRMKSALSYILTAAIQPFATEAVKIVKQPVTHVSLKQPQP